MVHQTASLLINLFGFDTGWSIPPCHAPVPCEFTTAPEAATVADAVVFHATSLHRASVMAKRPGQKWVVWCMESAVTVTTLGDPHAMRPFDLTMTYQRTSDVWTPYISRRLVDELRAAPQPKTSRLPVARVQSNPYDRSGRNSYAAELSRYVKVASYGRFATTVAETIARGREAKLSAIARHKFTLAFENSVAFDYVTEKFFDPLVAGSVPVYLGAPNVGEFAPAEHCYINTADFAGPRQLGAYLDHLDRHDDEYEAYLAWKRHGPNERFRALVETSAPRPFCRLAEILAEARGATG